MARSGRYRSRTWCACGPGSVAPTRSEQRAAADFAAVLEREGRSNAGPALRVALVEAVDAWLAELLGDVGPGVALVATGAYGRREPAPCSDLDLMLLHDRGTEEIAPLAERPWRPIWDAGMRLDHSVRTVDEALAVAATDLKTALGLLDARHVAGDGALVASLRERALERWRATARERLEQLRAACQRRAERHGELAFLLEPDLKEARGGLRDGLAVRAISATWVAAGLDRRGQAAYGLLLDTRQALHLELLEQGGGQVGRARAVVDRLGLQEQEAVAARLGEPGAEALMRAVHEAGRTLARALDQSWRRVDARHAGPAVRRWRRPVRRQLGGGVVAYDGEVLLAAGADLAEKPWLALEVAAAAAGAGMPLAPQTLRRLEARPPRLPEPWPPRAREALVALLGAGASAIGVIEALDQAGVMDTLLPEWERVRCKPQHNPFHRWTVDRHLVETAVHAAALVRRVGRPDLLLLAALLHDLGKGWPGDHAVTGARLAATVGTRLGLPTGDRSVLVDLVRNHLLLADTATRRDLDDPATVSVADGMAVIRLSADPRHGRDPDWRLVTDDLRRAFQDRLPLERRLAEREAAYRQPAPLRPPPRVLFDDRASDLATVIEVRCADGPAVLYRITRALDSSGARVRSARIATYGAEVVDAFYVLGPDGRRLDGPPQRATLVTDVIGTLR